MKKLRRHKILLLIATMPAVLAIALITMPARAMPLTVNDIYGEYANDGWRINAMPDLPPPYRSKGLLILYVPFKPIPQANTLSYIVNGTRKMYHISSSTTIEYLVIPIIKDHNNECILVLERKR